VLVSVMYVNSEVGMIEPIREIGKIIKKINEKRLRDWEKRRPAERGQRPQPIYFHTDATQAINFCNCDVEDNFIDLLSLSAHKIYGPKGVGALYIRTGTPLISQQKGGHQEKNLRSGTLNVSGIVGLGSAIDLINKKNQAMNNAKISKLRDRLAAGLLKNIPKAILNTDCNNSCPAHAHFTFPGAEGESILISLDLEGIAVSTGSACASGSLEPSHVLLAMCIKPEIAHNSIRFTLGKYNTEAEIKKVIKVLPPIIERLRKMNPIYK
ncbi:MAG: aminotransferase class V-fold PLP-dependent enzyme, partial [Candidatus Falkowbacteria bacterium]|nr:aminotransferase class V-fold PLP-dependent enzyme [Candidatus Falkowbacteria bacterium]